MKLAEYVSNLVFEDRYVGSSDKAVYKRLAMHKWNHLTHQPARMEAIKKKYPGIPNNDSQLIKWFKEQNGKLVPSDKEFIPRGEWNQLEQVGEIESSLMSPHKWSFFEYICDNPRPSKNKVLTIFECSNSKPYCQDPAKEWYFARFKSFTDFACGAYGIVPEEYSMLYPVREDEWAHSDESESVAFKYNLVSANRGYKYIKAQKYEKVIVMFQNHAPEEFLKWLVNIDANIKDKFIFVNTDALETKLKRKYPQLGNGLLITRWINLDPVHEAYMKALYSCLDGDDKKRLNELRKYVEDGDKTAQKHWIKKTNEEFDITPYKTDEPGWEIKLNKSDLKLHSYDSDITKSKVDEFKVWIKSWAKDQDAKEIDKKTKWFDEKLVFTPLDLLIIKEKIDDKNSKFLDIDEQYWNMMKAIEELAGELKLKRVDQDKYHRYDYLWCFERVFDEIKKDDLIKYCDRVGVSQYYQNVLDR